MAAVWVGRVVREEVLRQSAQQSEEAIRWRKAWWTHEYCTDKQVKRATQKR